MIIEALMNLVYLIFSVLTAVLKVPGMPSEVSEMIGIGLEYITTGIAIAGNYLDLTYLFLLFTIVAAVDFAILVYKVVMWVLKKIPILNIK